MADPEEQIGSLLSSLSAENLQGWRRIEVTKNRQQRRYASLLRLRAFKPWKFTEHEHYLRGKDRLEIHRFKAKKRVVEGRANMLKEVMGGLRVREESKEYLDKGKLMGKGVRVVLRHFRRPFGRAADSSSPPLPPVKPHPVDPLPHVRNQYIAQRMETLLKCMNVTPAAVLKQSLTEVGSPLNISRFSATMAGGSKRPQKKRQRSKKRRSGSHDFTVQRQTSQYQL